MRWSTRRVVRGLAAAVFVVGFAGCDLLPEQVVSQRCVDYCSTRTRCLGGSEASCQRWCDSLIDNGNAPSDEFCASRESCSEVRACSRCSEYCDDLVACELDDFWRCQNECEETVLGGGAPPAEPCVLNEACDTASLCLLCDEYCAKLASCGVSTDADCSPACQTVVGSGGSEETYQCVIRQPCDDIANCGI